ncbi:MAG: glycosyltransferase family 4 protein, partial [Anaerolineales bacterium]
MASRVLVVVGDALPLPGYPTSGAGLRAWGLGCGLSAHGFDVSFAMLATAWRGEAVPAAFEYPVLLWHPGQLVEVIRQARPEAVVFCHWPSVQIRQRLDVPTVIDFHGPHILERAFQNQGEVAANALLKIEALRKADYYVCAGEKQKSYFLAWLLISGIDVTQDRIGVVPVCLSPELPEPEPPTGAAHFVYGGVYLPWQDPTLGLITVAEVLAERGTGTLSIFGGGHPVNPIEVPPLFRTLEKQLKAHPRVRFEGIRPRDEVIEVYRRATAAVDVMVHNYERELAFTTRTVEYLWCGLPVIYNNYAELSSLIAEYEAGWVLDPLDREGLARIVRGILAQPELAHERGRNAQRLVRERLTWERATEPLAAFLRAPRLRPSNALDLPAQVALELGEKDFWSRELSV